MVDAYSRFIASVATSIAINDEMRRRKLSKRVVQAIVSQNAFLSRVARGGL